MVALHLLTHHTVFHSLHHRSPYVHHRRLPTIVASATHEDHIGRRHLIGAAISLSPLLGGNNMPAFAEDVFSEWERVYLPIDPGVVLLDIAFVPDDPSHGFLLGTRQTILETKDRGDTWVQRSIASAEDEDFNYRFNSISFKGKEGWIVGKPNILLYTADAGDNWKRIPLSAQLPGDMHNWINGSRSHDKEERPRFFDSKAKRTCWDKAKHVPGRDPDRWRIDAAGNIVCKRLHTCQGCLCFEYDHIVPFSKGGESVADNCQILQTRVNRSKSNMNGIGQRLLRGYSCDVKFSDEQLDVIEMAVYGSIVRPGKQCVVGSVDAILGGNKSRDRMITCKKD